MRRSVYWILAAVCCVAAFVFLATLNSAGYRYGASDQAFYIPAILDRLEPALFPRDSDLIAAQARLTFVDETIAGLATLSRMSLPSLMAVLYVTALAVLTAAAAGISAVLYRTRWASAALLAALTLRHAIAKSGTNTLEGYFHPRQLAFALGALAVAAFLRRRAIWALVFVALAAPLHPTTTMWFVVWLTVAAFVVERRLRIPVVLAAALAVAGGVWALTAGPLAGRLGTIDPSWRATLASKDYLFPLRWPASAWLMNLGYVPIILWIYRRRRAAGLASREEAAIVIGCLSLLLVFASALTLQARDVALALQLQPARIFWMLDFLAVIYVVWAMAEGTRAAPRRAAVAAAVILAISVARGAYVAYVRFPERSMAQIQPPDSNWRRAMAWARATPRSTHWLADPTHAARYGTSVRVAAERDVFVEEIKDTAVGLYDRRVAMRTRERMQAIGNFAELTPTRVLDLASRYDLDYLVAEQPLNLPLAFRSGAIRVYRLR